MSSASKWALLGGARTTIQLLSYEVISGLALISPLMMIGSLSLIDINNYQSEGLFTWVVFFTTNSFYYVCNLWICTNK